MYGVSIINKVTVKKTEISSSSIVTEEHVESVSIAGNRRYNFYQYGKLNTKLT